MAWLASCTATPQAADRTLPVDAPALRRIFERHVARQLLTRGLTPEGLFRTDAPEGALQGSQPQVLLAAQGRAIYTLVLAYEALGNSEYREAAAAGSELLLQKGWDRAHGGFFWGFDALGRVPPDTAWDQHSDKRTLGQAIAALALAATSRATGEARYWSAACDTWDVIENRLAGAAGGYVLKRPADFSSQGGQTDLDTLVHTFEALLGLRRYAPSSEDRGRFDAPLEALASFVLERRIVVPHSGESRAYVPEEFDAAGRPLLTAQTGLKGTVNYGHNAELAYLLSRAVEEGMPETWLEPAEAILRYAVEQGTRPDGLGGLLVLESETQRAAFEAGDKSLWVWPALEISRATLHWSAVRGFREWEEPFRQTWDSAQRRFLDAKHGGWRERSDASSPKLNPWYGAPYHAGMFLHEALRLAELVKSAAPGPRSRPPDPGSDSRPRAPAAPPR